MNEKTVEVSDQQDESQRIITDKIFALNQIRHTDPLIRALCATWEECALQLVHDSDTFVRMECAEKWQACAELLFDDGDPVVRKVCAENYEHLAAKLLS